jgi:glycerol-3-phosphate acyltransferase PlsX
MLSSAKPRIGVDLMGGDNPPHQLLNGIIHHLKLHPKNIHLVLFCDRSCFSTINELIENFQAPSSLSIEIIQKKEFISLEDHPLSATKSKKDSTLWQGILDLKEQKIDAFISVGNTGALLAISHFTLNLLPSISRPALLTRLPTMKSSVALMDVGATTHATKDHLLQFAYMGSAYLRALGKNHFKVGLLNIGTEEHKGTLERKEAYLLIKELHQKQPDLLPHFIGNIEPQDVFSGNCDLVLTDGFSGNIFLKSAEGTSQLILKTLNKLAPTVISTDQAENLIDSMRPFFEHEVNPGALLTGVDGIVIKCHSYFDGKALFHAVCHAIDLIQGNFIEKIKKNLA